MPSARRKVRWGVLGVARIATQKVIPAMQRGEWSEVVAIASRDRVKAERAAATLGIATTHASYDDLLADADVDAVYIPLPNHLHVPWAIRAAEAGKHVLCEKPIALTATEVETLLAVRDRAGVLIQEAFMIRWHPQWERTIEIVRSGRLGPVRSVTADFSYFNVDPLNVRNIADSGGGGLMDIGCYLVHAARWIFNREPERVVGLIEQDPGLGVDRLTSAILDFGGARAVCTCGTQSVPFQRVNIFGVRGRLEVEVPFNAPPDRACRIVVDQGLDVGDRSAEAIELEICDQYTRQGDALSRVIREGGTAPLPLEDSVANMRVIDAVRRSAASGNWEEP